MRKMILQFLFLIAVLASAFSLEVKNVRAKQDSTTGEVLVYFDVVGRPEKGTKHTIELYVTYNFNVFGPLRQVKGLNQQLHQGENKVKWQPAGEVAPGNRGKSYFSVVVREEREVKVTAQKAINIQVPEHFPHFIEHDGLRLVVREVRKIDNNHVDVYVHVENRTREDKIYNQGAFAYQLRFAPNISLDHSRIFREQDGDQPPHRFTVPANGVVSGKIPFSDRNGRAANLNPGDIVRFIGNFNQHNGEIENIPAK